MHYYDAYIFAGAAAIVFGAVLIIGRKSKIVQRIGLGAVIAAVAVFINLLYAREGNSFMEYDKIFTSRSVIVAGEETVELPRIIGTILVEDVSERPVYAQESDVTELCSIQFSNGTKMRMCKLKNSRLYPENTYNYYHGQCYCFLSDKLFYRNAFYLFSDEYAEYLIVNIMDSVTKPIETSDAIMAFNAKDVEEHMAHCDFGFVGKVVDIAECWAPEIPEMLSDNGVTYIRKLPYMEYIVEVTESIKGDLEVGERRDLRKTGGLNYSESAVVMRSDDVLPEKGNRYIFLAVQRDNGTMWANGAYSTIPLDGGEKYSTYPDGTTFGPEEIEKYREAMISIQH